MKQAWLLVVMAILLGFCLASIADAQPQNTGTPQVSAAAGSSPIGGADDPQQIVPDASLEKVGQVLLVFLVLSVVFETALTPIFNWRLFLERFEGKGVKTPIIVLLAFVVFWGYDLDIIRDLLVALGYQTDNTLGGQILTALLIAGGSDGVFRILTRLRIRDPDERKEKAGVPRLQAAKTSDESPSQSSD